MKKIKFTSIHSIEIAGSSERPVLKFTGVTKNNIEYNVEAVVDDYDVKSLIRESMNHFKKVEDSMINRLRGFRQTMNYSNSEPKINYDKP